MKFLKGYRAARLPTDYVSVQNEPLYEPGDYQARRLGRQDRVLNSIWISWWVSLDHTRVTMGAQAVGIAQGALDFALGEVKERMQFGRRIADFPGTPVHDRRHGDDARGGPAVGVRRGRQVRTRRP